MLKELTQRATTIGVGKTTKLKHAYENEYASES